MSRTLPPLLLLLALLSGCTSHSQVTDFHGVDGIRGVPIEYQMTTTWALHGLFVIPLIGDASTGPVVEAFTEEAAARGSERVRIVGTSSSVYWWVFPPISFFVHPVSTTVEGDVEVAPGAGS